MIIELVRYRSRSDAIGTYGELHLGDFSCFTVEQPWRDNEQGHSCIPVGSYDLLPYESPAHGHTVVFHNPALNIYGTPALIPSGVHGRSLCEIHNANWPGQVMGCVGVGDRLTDIATNGLGVTNSVATLSRLRAAWGDMKDLTAIVRWDS